MLIGYSKLSKISMLFMFLLMQLNCYADTSSSFTGYIYAEKEGRYLKVVSKEKVVFAIDRDVIQRVTYTNKSKYRGIAVYPDKGEVIIFRAYEALKRYTVMSLKEYEDHIKQFSSGVRVPFHQRIGFSTHFLLLDDSEKKIKPLEISNKERFHADCEGFLWSQKESSSDSDFAIQYCTHLGVPRSWLNFVELGIPDEITGFPVRVALNAISNAASQRSAFGGTILAPKENNDSMGGKLIDLAGKGLQTINRAIHELEEFTYQVIEIAPGPVKKVDLELWRDFVRMSSLEDLQRTFPDFPVPGGSSSDALDLIF